MTFTSMEGSPDSFSSCLQQFLEVCEMDEWILYIYGQTNK